MKTLKESILGSMGMGDKYLKHKDIPREMIQIVFKKTAELFGKECFWQSRRETLSNNMIMYSILFHQGDIKHKNSNHRSTNVSVSEVNNLYKITKEEMKKQEWHSFIHVNDPIHEFSVIDSLVNHKLSTSFKIEYHLYNGVFSIWITMNENTVMKYLDEFNKITKEYGVTIP